MTGLHYDDSDGDTFDATPVECFKCGELVPVSDTEVLIVETARQTHWSPAEWEEQVWCTTCRRQAEERDAYLAENEDYERARANGWAD